MMQNIENEMSSAIIRHMLTAHTHKIIARLVLVWFALFIGVAIASPIVHPTETQMVCTTSGGMKMVVSDEGGLDVNTATNMDCPLCTSVSVPVPNQAFQLEIPSALVHALHPIAAAHIAFITAPPLPSRGPPLFS